MVRSCLAVVVGAAAPALAQWAAHVHSYAPGSGVAAGYDNPARALGEPSRMTSFDAVTPFNPAWEGTHIVSIGSGGSLVLRFNTPVTDDAAHPFGIDLLVFGNTGYADQAWPSGIVGGLLGSGNGSIEVSADGSDWRAVGALADSPYPTLGYSDFTEPYPQGAGQVPADFTRPVDPAFVATNGMTFAQIVAAYAGSGGGTGVDLAGTGLAAISYVRIRNLATSGTVEIDALAAVPAPASLALFGLALITGTRRRRA